MFAEPITNESGSSITSSVLEEWLAKEDSVSCDDCYIGSSIVKGDENSNGEISRILKTTKPVNARFNKESESKQAGAKTIYPFTLVTSKKSGFFNVINSYTGIDEISDLESRENENSILHFPSVKNLVKRFNVVRAMDNSRQRKNHGKNGSRKKKNKAQCKNLSPAVSDNQLFFNNIYDNRKKNYDTGLSMTNKKEKNIDDTSPYGSEDLMIDEDCDVNVICCSKEWSGEVFYELYVYGIVDDKTVEEFRTIEKESDRLLKLCEILANISQEQARNLIVKSKTVAEFIQGIFVHKVEGEMISRKQIKEDIPSNNTSKRPSCTRHSKSIQHTAEISNTLGQNKEKTPKYKTKTTSASQQKKTKLFQRKNFANVSAPSVRDKQIRKTHVYFSDEANVVKDLSKETGIAIRYNIPVSEDPVIPEIVVTKTDIMTPSPAGITAMFNVKDEDGPTVQTFDKKMLPGSISVNISDSNLKNIQNESIIFSDLTTKPVQRTQSFPVCNSEKRGRKKKGTRVSFCSLPPTEFEVESDTNVKPLEPVPRKPSLKHSKISVDDLHGKKIEDDTLENNQVTDKPSFSAAAEIDEINEMLMDFLEEIEAESITVKDCIKDALKLGIITKQQAYNVLPSYNSRPRKDVNNNQSSSASDSSLTSDSSNEYNDKITSSELHSQSQTSLHLHDDVFDDEQSGDKLYDLLAGMSLNDLSRCREKTLGRLCHLSTYEAYENMQKNAKLSALYKEDLEGEENPYIEENYNSYECNGAWELSPVEPARFYVSESEASDVSAFEYEAVTPAKQTPNVPTAAQLCQIKSILPILKDEGVLEARQLWSLRETLDATSQARILASEMSKPKTSKCFKLLLERMPELEWVSDILNNPSIQPPTPYPRRKHSQSFRSSTSSSITSEPTFLKTSTPRRTVSLPRSQHKPSNLLQQINKDELADWCTRNNLKDKTLDALRLYGYNNLCEVLEATEDDLEELSGINWAEKAKLWLVIENIRSQHNNQHNFNDILRVFDK